MVANKQVIFSNIPEGYPVAGKDITIKNSTIDLDADLPKGDFILKNLVLSVDPYMRGRMRDASIKSYAPAFPLGETMTGDTMSVVLKSNNPDYKVDDLVYGRTAQGLFEEYSQVSADYAKHAYVVRNDAKENGLPLSHYVGVLAMPGMTAYWALQNIGKPKKGESLYVSAASGAVGLIVSQIGKALGLHVVGSVGSDEKVEYLKSIGIDAFNYKTNDIDAKLGEFFPNGIDIYFESVGGKMLDLVFKHANNFGRIIACGMISQYNLTNPEPIYNTMNIVAKRLTVQGFIIMDHLDYEPQFLKEMTPLLVSGQIKYREDISEGIESTAEALIDVLRGDNHGKKVVKIADL
ncbi:NAD(P)-binding protein [Backusella circina FSU 941]|nr:NAD(P)-binding protein [Backusella circina FSU 941]